MAGVQQGLLTERTKLCGQLAAEEEAKKGVEALLESKLEMIAQLETAKAEVEAELAKSRGAHAATGERLQQTAEELHTTQRAKDLLERDLGEAVRVQNDLKARAQREAEEHAAALESERTAAAEKATAVAASHEAVLNARDETITGLKASVEREIQAVTDAEARAQAAAEAWAADKTALQARLDAAADAREEDRSAAAAAAAAAAEREGSLSAQLVEQGNART